MIKLQRIQTGTHAALACAAIALTACGSVPTGQVIAEAGAQPSREQAESAVRAHMRRTLRDPDSVKDFDWISGPDLVTGTTAGGSFERAWLVCVEYNAKNAYGGYTGITTESYPLRFSSKGGLEIISRINWASADKHC